MNKKLGFIGLGTMGKPMTKNLLRADYEVIVHSRSPGPIEEVVEEFEGAISAPSPRDVAEEADVIMSCVPDSPDVKKIVLEGENPIIEGLGSGKVYIDMSTISPVVTRSIAEKIQEKGSQMLDAPISGGEEGAIEGTLSIMVGGEEDVFKANLEILEVMGDKVTYVGENGAGQIAKACNQIVVALSLGAVGEALVLAEKAGVDPERVAEAIKGGAADCWALNERSRKMLESEYEPGFKSSYHYKDLGIIMDTAREYGSILPLSHLVHELFGSMVQKGRGGYDHSGIASIIRDLSGEKKE